MQTILKIPGFTDSVLTHILAGLGAGFFAVCIGSPVDVVKFSILEPVVKFANKKVLHRNFIVLLSA